MTVTPFNPDSWMDVVALLGLGLIGLVTAGLPLWHKAKEAADTAKTTEHKVTEIHEQTVNDHGQEANMRDQLDRIEQNQARMERRQDELADDMKGVKKDVGRLADSVIDDRAMHHKDVERLDGDIDELRRKMT